MSRWVLLLLGVVWICAAGAGLRMVWAYDATPGAAAAPASDWPPACRLQRPADRSTLVMFAHPRCPCTRASIEQLASVMHRSNGRVRTFLFLYRPKDAAPEWDRTDIRASAEEIEGVRVLVDTDGTEAGKFRAATSGQTMLYDASGRLVFSGGLTGSRGHSSVNAGSDAVLAWVLEGSAKIDRAPVYGCSLLPDAAEGE